MYFEWKIYKLVPNIDFFFFRIIKRRASRKITLVNVEASSIMDYSLPAGIFSDDPESYRPQKGEKKIAKWLKIKAKALSENVDKQKSLKSKHMGHTFVKCLLNRGMEVCVEKILSYLNWFHVALLLALVGSPMNNLNHLAATVSHSIIKNTNHTNHHLLGKNLIHENTVTLIYLQKLIFYSIQNFQE